MSSVPDWMKTKMPPTIRRKNLMMHCLSDISLSGHLSVWCAIYIHCIDGQTIFGIELMISYLKRVVDGYGGSIAATLLPKIIRINRSINVDFQLIGKSSRYFTVIFIKTQQQIWIIHNNTRLTTETMGENKWMH